MRAPAATDFHIDVEGVGNFRFARRKMADELKINVEYSRKLDGCEKPTPYLDLVCTWLSTLSVLTVSAPADWDLENMDPLEDDTYTKLMRVYSALREKEGSFRRKATPGGAGGGSADGDVDGVLVSAQVQPAAQ